MNVISTVTHVLHLRRPALLGLLLVGACGSDDVAGGDELPEPTPGTSNGDGTTHAGVETTESPEPSTDADTTANPGTTIDPGTVSADDTSGSDESDDGSSTTAGDVLDCDTLLGPGFDDPDAVAFEVFDTWRTTADPITVAMRVDDCPLALPVDAVRSVTVGQGFFAGEHELVLTYDGVDLPAFSLASVPRDLFWFAVSNEQPPQVFAFAGTSYFPPSAWNVSLVNMSPGTMAVHAVTGPVDDPQYDLLAEDVAYGEGITAIVPADAQLGARVRIDVDDLVIFEGNPQFFLDCPPSSWPTRSGMIGIVDVVPGIDVPGLNMAVGYGVCFAPAPEENDDLLLGAGTRWTRG